MSRPHSRRYNEWSSTSVTDRQITDLLSKLAIGFLRLIVAACVLTGLMWIGDALSLRFRIPAREPLGSVSVRNLYSVKKKNGSTEFFFDDPVLQTCVNSLLPQKGYRPCWWVSRHTVRSVDLCNGCSVTPTRNQ